MLAFGFWDLPTRIKTTVSRWQSVQLVPPALCAWIVSSPVVVVSSTRALQQPPDVCAWRLPECGWWL